MNRKRHPEKAVLLSGPFGKAIVPSLLPNNPVAEQAGCPTDLLPERIGQLSDNFAGKGLIADAVAVGELVFRHPERPEQQVPNREGSGEVGIAALIERGVMP